MTLRRDPGPGVGTYTSTLWSVTVGGLAQHTWGKSRNTAYAIEGYWGVESLEVALTRYQSDEAQTVRVTLLSGPITSVVVYPRRIYDDRVEIQGGVAVISVPPDGKAVVVVNGVRKYRLHISADPLDDGYDGGDPSTDVYDGTQLEAASDRTLVFEPGVYDLTADAWGDKLFPVRDRATVYMALGSWVIGTFAIRSDDGTQKIDDATILGGGNLSGEFTTREAIEGLPFQEQFDHSMIFGWTSVSDTVTNVIVRGITVWQSPFYGINGPTKVVDCAVLSPWHPNADAVNCAADSALGNSFEISRNIFWCGDDTVNLLSYSGNGTVKNNVVCSTSGATFLLGYQDQVTDLGYTTTCTDNYVIVQQDYQLLPALNEEYGTIVQGWVDSPKGRSTDGRYHVTFDGLYIDGDTSLTQILNLGTRSYPWGTPLDQQGRVSDIVFRNVVVETTPAVRSIIRGTDRNNTAGDISFENVTIGGVPLSVRNFSDYFDVDEECYGVTVDGRLVA